MLQIRSKRRRRSLYALLCFAVALTAGELFARFYLGLGSPPLTQPHRTIEYLFAPNQRARPFGNRFDTNAYSMRSDDFPQHRASPSELRVLVLGDSIINGGNVTDQDELATELLKRDLCNRLGRPVFVGNISAGSWGPPNLLAYVKEFGVFDADMACIVLSSHDATDFPTFEPLDPVTQPQEKPSTALWDAVTRYVPRYFRRTGVETTSSDSNRSTLPEIRELVDFFRNAGAQVFVLQYLTRQEVLSEPEPGYAILSSGLEGVEILQLGPRFKSSLHNGDEPYRPDGVHPNEIGQRLIFEALREVIGK